ncbi:hypothetical protein Z043_101682 [Scleropages formosus]|uniref:Sema domain-containing protein n=1 Tax=Scleropages formosus TaxID=113540 RepID=A0A0P7UWL4_SCLFO|nr:hypothetical protein Z043_101682 [Scleropages formosus]
MAPSAGRSQPRCPFLWQGLLLLWAGSVASRSPGWTLEPPCQRPKHPLVSHTAERAVERNGPIGVSNGPSDVPSLRPGLGDVQATGVCVPSRHAPVDQPAPLSEAVLSAPSRSPGSPAGGTQIEPWIHRFWAEDTVDYSQLIVDPGQSELIVGARSWMKSPLQVEFGGPFPDPETVSANEWQPAACAEVSEPIVRWIRTGTHGPPAQCDADKLPWRRSSTGCRPVALRGPLPIRGSASPLARPSRTSPQSPVSVGRARRRSPPLQAALHGQRGVVLSLAVSGSICHTVNIYWLRFVFSHQQEAEWPCDEFTKGACFSRGKSEEECQNYIRVLLVSGDRLFTCGTNAFTPICTNRTLTNLTEIHDQISGMARCPYSPQHNSTALITSSGELYAATAMDFSGRDPAIYRSLGGLPPLRTAQYNSKWLNEPNFVSSYDIGNFTYFFFRENAVEHDCGKTVFSRAARLCKNDVGGRFLLEDTWTTFMKARLNCSRPGEIPFDYNELQGTFFLPELELLYGIFTTNVNSIAASAVCVFNLSAIAQVFNGPFKYQENSRSAWLPYLNPNPDFQCGTIDYGSYVNLTERNLQDAQKFILMHEVVQPVTPVPHFMEDNVRFSHVAVDVVQGKDMLFHVIYLATDYGTIRKVLSPLSQKMGSCLLEEIELFPPGKQQPVRSLLILHSRSVLFVGIQDQVIKIPLVRCSFHKTRE